MTNPLRSRAAQIILAIAWTVCAGAEAIGGNENRQGPIRVPLVMTKTPAGTYKASIDVRIGDLPPLPFAFDTGSTGLHVFADAKLDVAGSHVQCSQTPTSVTYGNPPRIVFSGVMCNANLQIGTATAQAVPIAYLTKASCPATLPTCKLPDVQNPRSMGGYGIFGAGLTGRTSGTGNAPPPLLSMPGHYGQVYSVALTQRHGELILGDSIPANATAFTLASVTNVDDERWSLGKACLFVNEHAIGTCLLISFDTGNGVPWIHNVTNSLLPQSDGLVTPFTRIGFGPDPSTTEATSVVAGTAFSNRIHITEVSGRSLTNTSIQAFLDHYVTYDAVGGVIYVAPAEPR